MRFLLILLIGISLQTTSFAQVDQETLQQELEKMQKAMEEQLKNFNFEGFHTDTTIFKQFTFPEGFDSENYVMPNDVDMNEMLKMMERQMQQLDMEGMLKMMQENLGTMDFSELEKMMIPFKDGAPFIMPAPEQLEKQEEHSKKEKQKKRKVYKM